VTSRRKTASMALVAIVFAFASCGGSHSASNSTVAPNGRVVGRLGSVGGPRGGFHPFSGTVTLSRGHVPQAVHVASNGRFMISVRPGIYRITGLSPLYGDNGATCGGGSVHVRSDETVSVNVACQEK
jgi:hypothetical protein